MKGGGASVIDHGSGLPASWVAVNRSRKRRFHLAIERELSPNAINAL